MCYKSPISVIQEKIQVDIDNAIYKAVQTVNIHVDREELIKALQYDRDQYDKGYIDGCKAVVKEILANLRDGGITKYAGVPEWMELWARKYGVEGRYENNQKT